MTGEIYRDIILKKNVRLFTSAMGANFVFIDENAHPHHPYLEEEDITHLESTYFSSDSNTILHAWEYARATGHPLPTSLLELRRALIYE